MNKHLLIISSLLFIVSLLFTKTDVFSMEDNIINEYSYIFDRQQSDIESMFNIANSNKTVMPELRDTMPSPSLRLLPSQKKSQQNQINNVLLKRFSSEVKPTENYNIKRSFPLSSKDNLIVIVRHLII